MGNDRSQSSWLWPLRVACWSRRAASTSTAGRSIPVKRGTGDTRSPPPCSPVLFPFLLSGEQSGGGGRHCRFFLSHARSEHVVAVSRHRRAAVLSHAGLVPGSALSAGICLRCDSDIAHWAGIRAGRRELWSIFLSCGRSIAPCADSLVTSSPRVLYCVAMRLFNHITSR